jgi:hypothetical protein
VELTTTLSDQGAAIEIVDAAINLCPQLDNNTYQQALDAM